MAITHPPTFLGWGLRLLVLEPPIIRKKTTHCIMYSIVHQNFDSSKSAVPCAAMLAVEETVLLIPIPSYTATTLIVQLLPGGREEKV